MPRKQNVTKPGHVKSGALSVKEKADIRAKAHSHTAEQIASQMQRSAKQVKEELAKVKGVKPDAGFSLKEKLEARPEWATFRKQFSFDEQQEFKHQYVQIMSQLTAGGDIYPTEELQVFQVITLKIQIDRTLEAQRKALNDMDMASSELDTLRNAQLRAESDGDKEEIDKIDKEMIYWGGVQNSGERTNIRCTNEYKVYSDKQDKMLVALKSTRDQRIKVFENSDKSILGLVRLLVQEDQRDQKGTEAEMMKLAAQKEKRRLAKPHKFADGITDRPILTPETVFYEDEDEDQIPDATEDVFAETEPSG